MNSPISLPDAFVRNLSSSGPDAAQWLAALPALLAECASRWDLTLLSAFPNLSCHYVTNAMRADGTLVVLKIAPKPGDVENEIAALRAYDGRGAVRLLAADHERGAMLLERLTPGETLTGMADETHDDEATAIAADVMRRLWRPAPAGHAFPNAADWGDGFRQMRAHFGDVGPFPRATMEEAESLFTDLLDSSDDPVLLHGDLHHDNILSSVDTWLAIDPKGLIGEPAYEVGAILRNVWGDRHAHSDPGALLDRRARQLADELGLDLARVRGWAIAQAALSAWWTVEDGGEADETMEIAHLLRKIQV